MDKFIADPNCRVFLGNLQAVGIGVDGLQKVCSRIIMGEPDWSPANNFEQGVGRLDRGGQTESVLAEFMVAPGSIVERIMGTAVRKLQHIHTSLDQEWC